MQLDSKWWIPHLVLALAIPAFAVLLIIGGAVQAVFGGEGGGSPGVAAYAIVSLYTIFVFIALYGYDVESRRMEAAGSEWVPVPWVWAVLHFVLTPFIASALYLYCRHKTVGIPWHQLTFWRRPNRNQEPPRA